MIVNLTNEEKQRFLAYLRNEQVMAEQMLEQAERINSEPLIRKLKLEATAHRFVANRLESWESQTLGGAPLVAAEE